MFYFFALSYIEVSIAEFTSYQFEIENYLSSETERLEAQFDKVSSGIAFENRDYENYLFESHSDMAQAFPKQFRISLLIQIISFIEFQLKKICRMHSNIYQQQYTIADLTGTDFEKCKLYLQRSGKIDFGLLKEEWDFINTMYKVRNKFVHHSGTIDKTDKDYNEMQKLQKLGYLTIVEEQERWSKEFIIVLNKELNSKLLDNTLAFFRKLIEQLGPMDFIKQSSSS